MKPLPLLALLLLLVATVRAEWRTLDCSSQPHARHEAGLTAFDGKLYLLGGRRIQPVSIFDPKAKAWSEGAAPPIEIHHFQPVVHEDAIWVVGAMTGKFPNETPVDRILIYRPRENRWEWGLEIPANRRRGGAGVSIHQGKLYLSAGITRGHMGGFIPWLDRLDLETGLWTQLPDAPVARDHFQSAVAGGKLYLAGGRQTSRETDQVFSQTIEQVDVFDFERHAWNTLPLPLPTPRAGNSTFALDSLVIVGGGESATQKLAHSEVEAFDINAGKWILLPSLNQGRHGTGIAAIDGVLYTASGCGNRGGRPELEDIEAVPARALLESAP